MNEKDEEWFYELIEEGYSEEEALQIILEASDGWWQIMKWYRNKERLNEILEQNKNELEKYKSDKIIAFLKDESNLIKDHLILLEELEIIKNKLNKETPKKPYYEGDGYADGVMVYDVAYCPNCSNRFEEYENNGWGENYCHNCGQKLDWENK